jgi:desulfoferrodoxin-like iron-binding protein
MAVERVGEMYVCNVCNNEVTVTKVGGGTLVCCGQDMGKIDPGSYEQVTRNLPDSGGV